MTRAGEIRVNRITGRSVVVVPGRAAAVPDDPDDEPDRRRAPTPEIDRIERDPRCPFCPGNEEGLPPVLQEIRGPSGSWAARAVENRYPAFDDAPASADDHGDGPRARGLHEVLVETPRHDTDLPDLTAGELAATLRLYRDRARAAAEEASTHHLVLFRNRGRAAGASQDHPHAQLVASRSPLPGVRDREERMRRHREREGRCLVCQLPRLDPGASRRTVAEGAFARVFVPWAPEAPGETWIVPRTHRPAFGSIPLEEATALGHLLGRVTTALRRTGRGTAYNLWIHTSRPGSPRPEALHWFAVIRPRLLQPAGLELAAGLSVCPSDPESDASELRDALPPTVHASRLPTP